MELERKIYLIITIVIYILYLSCCGTSSIIRQDTSSKNNTNFTPIVGGQYARPGQFPWMAIVHQLYMSGGYGSCGGSIISERWVLTAAHCVTDGPRRYLVVLGETDQQKVRGQTYLGQGVAMMTSTVVVHPQYAQDINDIALLYMPRTIPFGQNINKIGLSGRSYTEETLVGKRALIMGWGNTGQHRSSRDLQWAQIPILSGYECFRDWLQTGPSHICTQPMTGADACIGDSGGPLVIATNKGTMQIGIVSFGDDYCPSSRAGVFTRVSSFIEWIQQVTAQ